MGLDLALGVVVLLGAIRGWFRGFVLQAIQIAALVGCVYLADPLRDLARPYAQDHLPAIQPAVLDMFLWWTAAVLGYVVSSGVAVSLVHAARKRSQPDKEVRRGDQGLGLLAGILKGALVASFLAWGLTSEAPRYLQAGGRVGEQVETSRVLKLSERYQPARTVWTSEPVQRFVDRVKSRGFSAPGDIETPTPEADGLTPRERIETARPAAAEPERPNRVAVRPRPLVIPPPARPLDPNSPQFLDQLDDALRESGLLDDREP